MIIDFETFSACPLGRKGAYNYANHRSTRILCMAWAENEGPVQVTTSLREMRQLLRVAEQIVAHNATFERLIINKVLGLNLPIERFYCTMAQARANNLPGSLDAVCMALGLGHKTKGSWDLIQACCTPPMDKRRLPELYAYCRQDLTITRALHQFLQPLTQAELEEYWESERINDRGIPVDMQWVSRAAAATADLKREAKGEIKELTGCTMGPSLTQWLWDRGNEEVHAIMERNNKSGMSRDQIVRSALLELDLDEGTRQVVDLLEAFGGSSVLKYQAIENQQRYGRVHGCYNFSGAGQTGRFSGAIIQPHNFPRKCGKLPRPRKITVATAMEQLRPTIRSKEGLTWGDWSTIEAVVCPWLTGEDNVLVDNFAEGADLYEVVADMLSVPRQVAKAVHLACQFGGGTNALIRTAKTYGVELGIPAAAAVAKWRRANRWSDKLAQQMYRAFNRAMRNPGEPFHAGRVSYTNLGDVVVCLLPCGRTLKYWKPEYEGEQLTALKTLHGKIFRSKLWHGRLIENVTQAVAADVLRDCLVRLADVPVIMHTHDEIMIEGDRYADRLKYEMEYSPTWGETLPLRAEIQTGGYYVKN